MRVPWLTLSLAGTLIVAACMAVLNLLLFVVLSSTLGQPAWDAHWIHEAQRQQAQLQMQRQHVVPASAAGAPGAPGSAGGPAAPAGPGAPGGPPGTSRPVLFGGPTAANVDAILNSSYIVGSHTVTVRPPTIAKLNPNASVFCILDSDPRPSALIPLLVKGTPPFKIDYEITSIDTGVPKRYDGVEISAADAVKAVLRDDGSLASLERDPTAAKVSSRRTGLYAITGSTTGIVRVTGVREVNGDPGKVVSGRFAQIVHCPSAAWAWSPPSASPSAGAAKGKPVPSDPAGSGKQQAFDRCVDDTFSTAIQKVGQAESVVTVESGTLVADAADPAAAKLNLATKESLDADTQALIQASRRTTTTVPVAFKVDQSTVHLFRIARVIDGFNNSIDYQTYSRLALPEPFQKSTTATLDDAGDHFVVTGRAHPAVRLDECDGLKIRAGNPAYLGLRFDGVAPFEVAMHHTGQRDGAPINEVDRVAGILDAHVHYQITEPGLYELDSVSDAYCPGSISLPASCQVQQVMPPTMTLSSAPIEEKCLGAVGASVNLTFTGEPPFQVEYVEERSVIVGDKRGAGGATRAGPVLHRREHTLRSIDKPRRSLVLSPSEPGMYQYTFNVVKDANYPEGVHLKGLSVTQIIHPHSSAHFVGALSRYTRCINDTVQLRVGVQGSGPWTLVYYVVHDETRTRYVKTVGLDQSGTDILVDGLQTAGLYLVDLAEITDVNGCTETVGSAGVTIDVLPIRPTVNFRTSKSVAVVAGGRAALPISVSGKAPFEIKYRSVGAAGVRTWRGGAELEVNGPGVFELLSVRDAVCDGFAVEPRVLEVTEIPKPGLSLAADAVTDADLCMDANDGVHVLLSGRPPFHVVYEHTVTADGGGKTHTDTRRLDTSVDTYPLSINTTVPGKHTYRLMSVSDANYATPVALGDNIPIVTRRFAEPGERASQCASGRAGHPLMLGVLLRGTPPFILSVDRRHDSSLPVTTNYTIGRGGLEFVGDGDAKDKSDKTDKRDKSDKSSAREVHATASGLWKADVDVGVLDGQGKYEFIITAVTDGTGCPAVPDKDVAEVAKTFVHVAEQAKITSLNPTVVCVGDVLSYGFQGSPPFTVGYEWNGVRQPDVVVADPIMTLWAGTAGELSITKVCNAMMCCDETLALDEGLRSTVHALPRAVVDGGHDLIDDIREGDESEVTVELDGEPPFSFSYSYAKGPVKRVGGTRVVQSSQDDLVTVTVRDYDQRRWSMATSQEGVFRVTAVRDRFCAYPRIIQSMYGANVVLQ
ncbi:hypothetical protein BC831DRAFT_477489 [Entophlyctis helioformis]|nr:hypothetical protein BC831DRAFT_477489 [Entophlyctis helioformis]